MLLFFLQQKSMSGHCNYNMYTSIFLTCHVLDYDHNFTCALKKKNIR